MSSNSDSHLSDDSTESIAPEILERVDRVREELRRRVRSSTTNQRQIERQAGWSRGYLSQVLQGHISLTILHVMTVLDALDTPPERFFAELFGSEPAPLDEIRQKLATYDAAFRELRDRGLISGLGDSGTLDLNDDGA
ncbi:MAG: helix-turn-helix transcriptional regulator [Acidobacteriota bacterium]